MIDINKIYQGDILQVLKTWPDSFVQCVVTSPPYWGLRDYGVVGQIGLEKTPEEYVLKIVDAFREVKRILKDDGACWLNLGDTYAGSWGAMSHNINGKAKRAGFNDRPPQSFSKSKRIPRGSGRWGGGLQAVEGLPPKNLVGIPWRVAFALQADGWYLRSDIIWSKPNPMPESVTDRPTKAHEYIFLLTKSERYYYNADAIKTPARSLTTKMPDGWDTGPGAHGSFHRNGREKGMKTLPDGQTNLRKLRDKQRGHSRRHAGFNDRWDQMEREQQMAFPANRRTVWEIPTFPFPEAHFATFPEDIPTLCIKAGSKEGDIILDPFMGSGTVAAVAKRLKRQWIGIELNPKYIEMAKRRIEREPEPLLVE